MKKVFLLMVLMATIVQVCQAQEKGKFRVGFDFGNVILHNGGGLLTAFEPKQNLTDNMNIGFRFENVVIIKKIDFGDDNSKKIFLAVCLSLEHLIAILIRTIPCFLHSLEEDWDTIS